MKRCSKCKTGPLALYGHYFCTKCGAELEEVPESSLFAIQEAEQMISEYDNGTRTPPGYSSAKEMFAAMDLEDEAELNSELSAISLEDEM